MKKTLIICLSLIFCSALLFSYSFHEMMNVYEQSEESILSLNNRVDYTYYLTVFLPPSLSTVNFANEYLYQEQFYYEWDGAWQEFIHYEYSFSNDLLSEYYMYMNTVDYQYNITYDGNNRLYQSVLSMDLGIGFHEYMRETFEYNDSGVLSNYLAEYWLVPGEWVNGVQWDITMSGDDITSILQKEWDQGNNTWTNDERLTLIWDMNQVVETLREEWVDGAWINDELRDFTYENGSCIEILEQDWSGAVWENHEMTYLTWENDVITYQLYKVWDGSNWIDDIQYTTTFENGKPIEDLALEWTGSEWVNHHKIEYLYNSGSNPNSIPNSQNFLTNYPNPFNPETTIEFNISPNESATLEIFNLKGEMILRDNIAAGQNQFVWHAADQASGVYFYRISSGNISETRKMILMK